MEKDIKTDYNRSREREDDSIDLRYIVDVIWDLKYWIVASVVAFLAAAYIYLKIATPEYTRSATLLIANDRMTGGMGSELQILSDITGMKANGLVQNEIYILKSRPLMQSVVEDLSLNVRYFRKHGLTRSEEIYKVSPLEFSLLSGSTKNKYPSIVMDIEVSKDTLSYTIRKLSFVSDKEDAKNPVLKEFKGRKYNFGDAVNLPDNNVVVLSGSDAYAGLLEPGKYKVVFISPKKMAKYYSTNLSAGTTDYRERSSVITLTIKDNIPFRADDILNHLIARYNEDTKAYMSLSTSNTIEFIDERLAGLESQLGDIESEAKSYKAGNALVDFALQSEAIIKKGTETDARLTQIGIQLQFMDMIKEYISKENNEFSLLPSNIGIEDTGLTNLIN